MYTVNLADKFSKFQDYFNPRVVGEINDFAVKAVKLKGAFIWHHHDREDAVVREGEFVIVPHGVEHMPVADEEVHIILLEPRTTLNTGNIVNERTVSQLERI